MRRYCPLPSEPQQLSTALVIEFADKLSMELTEVFDYPTASDMFGNENY